MGRQLRHPEEDNKAPESQASQTVRSMLRRTPVKIGGSMNSSAVELTGAEAHKPMKW
jgi:hypothetical protein